MYETLITKIKETLEAVDEVKLVFFVPKTKLTSFPCVFFKPDGMTNVYETYNENKAAYRFLAVVMVGVAGTTVETAFGTVLPHTVDAIIEKFNAEWDQGTIDGHRVTVTITSADAWEISEEQDGLIAYAPLQIQVNLLTSN